MSQTRDEYMEGLGEAHDALYGFGPFPDEEEQGDTVLMGLIDWYESAHVESGGNLDSFDCVQNILADHQRFGEGLYDEMACPIFVPQKETR